MTENQYKNFQTKLKANKLFRYFWQFWAIYSFVFFAAAFGYIYTTPHWQEIFALSAIAFILARGVVITSINFYYKRERPYQKFNLNPITSLFFSYKTHHPNSFPSRHTIAYMSVAAVVYVFFPVIGYGLSITALLAGVGRVVLGYHWPSDIVVGAILGAIIGFLTVYFGLPALFT